MYLCYGISHHYIKDTLLGYGMKKVMSLLALVIITLTLSACVQVTSETKPRNSQLAISSVRDLPVAYPQGSLFSLSPKYIKDTSLQAKQTQSIYHTYTNVIINDLQKNGFVTALTGQHPAFHVGFGIALSDDFSDEKINDKFGVTPGLPQKSDLTRGSFLIYIEDAATGQRVWRGIAQGFANTELTPKQRQQRAAIVVANVMKQFYQTN